MKYWLTTDTHFGHEMLIEKGYRPADFQEKIMKGFNIMNEGDVLIHLGDVCIGTDSAYNKWITDDETRPQTKNILVRGNHDQKSDSWYYEHGWDFVCDSFELNKYGKTILFTHTPRINHTSHINIHGHWHDNDHRKDEGHKHWYNDESYKLLALEHTNYKPVNLEKFI